MFGIDSAVSGLFSASQAKKMMAFQKESAQNAHQWEVNDLKKAGLNPVLSATGGGGARPSGGAMGSIQTSDGDDLVSSAMKMKKQKTELSSVSANKDLIEANTRLANAQALSAEVDAKNKGEEYRVMDEGQPGIRTFDKWPPMLKGPARTAYRIGSALHDKASSWVGRLKNYTPTSNSAYAARRRASNKENADSYREFLRKNPNYRKGK